MCEKRPGPRCNDKCKVRDVKYKKFVDISKKYPKNSAQYQMAAAELYAAQEVYDTTPKGIEELSTKTASTQDITVATRYAKGKITRDMQYDAIAEINSGRVSKIAYIFSIVDKHFDQEEIESIIESSRENRESFIIQNIQKSVKDNNITNIEEINQLIGNATSIDEKSYKEYIKKMREYFSFSKIHDAEAEKYLNELLEMSPPTSVNLYAYRSMGNALEKSKHQLGLEIHKIAALQDTKPEIAAEYFDAYREQYKKEYANLSPDLQPNPPRDWIEGTYKHSGIYNNPQSNFIPRDAATLYACHKMRTDLEAVPDFLKLSTKITAIDAVDDKYVATQVSRSGKLLNRQEVKSENEISRIIQESLTDSIILMHKVPEKILIESKYKHRFISLSELAERHLDSFDSSPNIVGELLNVRTDALSIYSGIRKKMLKTWATKAIRTNSEKLSFSPQGASRTVNLVR